MNKTIDDHGHLDSETISNIPRPSLRHAMPPMFNSLAIMASDLILAGDTYSAQLIFEYVEAKWGVDESNRLDRRVSDNVLDATEGP